VFGVDLCAKWGTKKTPKGSAPGQFSYSTKQLDEMVHSLDAKQPGRYGPSNGTEMGQ